MPRILRVLSMLLLLSAPALAQQQQLQPIFTAGKIIFNNPGPYSQAALEATSGLHVGDNFTYTTLANNSQKLMDTGLFADVQATVNGPYKAMTAIFTLKPLPTDQFLPVRFDNFIWEDPAALLADIQRTVPLFQGSLSGTSGTLGDQVNAALQSILTAKGISSPILVADTVPPSAEDSVPHINFIVTSPHLRIHSIQLTGVAPDMRPAIDAATAQLLNHDFSSSHVTTQLLAPYHDAGYLKATLADAHYATAPASGNLDLTLTATVQPGDLYHLQAIHFDGTDLISAEAFNQAVKLHPGDVASRKAFLETVAPISAIYRLHGYMNAGILPQPTFNDTAHTVTYAITVVPGAQYTLHSVQPSGLTPQQRTAFQSAWKLQPGSPYDPGYVENFIKHNAAQPPFLGTSITYTSSADPNTHQVDLTLKFVSSAPTH